MSIENEILSLYGKAYSPKATKEEYEKIYEEIILKMRYVNSEQYVRIFKQAEKIRVKGR